METNTQPVRFTKLGTFTYGEKFVLDIDDVFDPTEHLQFLGFDYKGAAFCSAANTDFVRGFETGLNKDTKVIKLSH